MLDGKSAYLINQPLIARSAYGPGSVVAIQTALGQFSTISAVIGRKGTFSRAERTEKFSGRFKRISHALGLKYRYKVQAFGFDSIGN